MNLFPPFLSLIALTILLSFNLKASEEIPKKVIILGETSSYQTLNTPAFEVDIHSMAAVWKIIAENSQPKLQPYYQQMSMTRSWVELNKTSNTCMLNKIKTPERQKISIYSDYPLSIFPPVRLITLKENISKFSHSFSLSKLNQLKQMKICSVKSRVYGKEIDNIIKNNSKAFFTRGAEDSSRKLVDMLLFKRVDAIIDFSFITEQHSRGNELTSIVIEEASKPILAYIACSKTVEGHSIIDAINKSYQTLAVQDAIKRFHHYHFGKTEQTLLKPVIDDIFPKLQDSATN